MWSRLFSQAYMLFIVSLFRRHSRYSNGMLLPHLVAHADRRSSDG